VAQVSLRGETLPGRDGIVGLIVDILAVVDRFARVGAVRKELSHHATHDVDERFRFECATCLLARGELDDALSQALLSDTAPAIQLMAAEVRKDAVVIERLAVEARGSIATRALTLLIRWDVFHRLNHAQFLAVMPHQEAEWRTLVRQNVGSELDGGHVSLVEDHAGALSKTSNSK
jgi:hypothetical protein